MTSTFLRLAALMLCAPAWAQTTASDAWARSTVASQRASAAFLTLRSPDAATLVAVSTPRAGTTELHTMSMGGDGVMQMRALPRLALPAGQAVTLTPGGNHLMLLDLRGPLKAGETVPLTLRIERPGKPVEVLQVVATVRPLGAAPMGMPSSHP